MIDAVAVVVPVHDEEAHLGACLASIDRALRALHRAAPEVRSLVVIVLDACRDGSAVLAREARLEHPLAVLEVARRNVGAARAEGMMTALAMLAVRDPSRLWLATTDADSEVPEGWLVAQRELACRGAHGVAGMVQVDAWGDYAPAYARAYEAWYGRGVSRTDDETHPHVHGANLGVRADAYLEVGGFLARETAEDHALWNALRAANKTLVTTRRAPVTTSARRLARAPSGFADFLRRHEREAAFGGAPADVTARLARV